MNTLKYWTKFELGWPVLAMFLLAYFTDLFFNGNTSILTAYGMIYICEKLWGWETIIDSRLIKYIEKKENENEIS